MAIFNWDGTLNLDFKLSGTPFDFQSDVLQISDPMLEAHQFDVFEIGTDLAIVKARDPMGVPLSAAEQTYAFLPNMLVRQVGGPEANPASSNVVLSNGGQFWIGDRLTDTLTDDAANDITALATQLNSVNVSGLGGGDLISTGDGRDRVYGNTGADNVFGGANNDSLYGGQENDTVAGGAGNDNVAGDLGNDLLIGGTGDDIIYGGAGNDVIDPDSGNDTVFAGNGNDSLSLGDSDTGDKLIFMDKLQDRVDIVSTTGNMVVFLGDHNDRAFLNANAGDIQVHGDGGNDTVESQSFGEDSLFGGVDDDCLIALDGAIGEKHLFGGFGRDTLSQFDTSGAGPAPPNTWTLMEGGEGDDLMWYARGLRIPDANIGGDGVDHLIVDGRTDLNARDQTFTQVEFVDLSDGFSDRIRLADGNVEEGTTVEIDGRGGEDTIDGSAESDGMLVLLGSSGYDSLLGGSLDDTLVGGADDDTLIGNGGSDEFVFDQGPVGVDLLGFEGGVDVMMFDGNLFGGMSAIDPYVGTDGAMAGPTDNLLIAVGAGYASVAAFYTAFVMPGGADTAKPGFYAFFNSTASETQLYFDSDMSNAAATLIARFTSSEPSFPASFDPGHDFAII
ncbi:MAG: calcium-binding protein [Alphaproteobacteria bacterium]